jgi:hypothetical protein
MDSGFISSATTAASCLPISSTGDRAPSSAEHHVQDVFAAVLAQAGKQGYASAEPLSDPTSLPEEITSSWERWFDECGRGRYTFQAGPGNPSVRDHKTAEDLKEDYGQILSNAYQGGGYADPSAYLKSLSAEDMEAIQQVQHLAEPIHVAALSDEAALNLLLPPGSQVDENRDGLTAIGAAYTLQFPNSNTPREARDAWEAATADLPESERMMHELQMCLPVTLANMHCDANGNFVRCSNPGDADWVNPMAAADYSYVDAANDWLNYLDSFKNQMPVARYESDVNFWTTFRDNLLR